ncbi:MAG: 3-hydroxyacyl-ACP dehydratase FabZ [Candidatus Eremiobacteraeota bacterium]|nr:3-hydroxyacyl-ACP dehydratase FabZ [Candidatus Eremiobacteraeota bacterium]
MSYPFTFVDKILHEEEGKIVGLKCVSFSEAFFSGHFPGKPVMPGVLILEGMLQTAEILIEKKIDKTKIPVLTGFEKIRFKKPVLPGDKIYYEIELLDWDGKTGKIKAEAKVGNEIMTSGFLTLTIKEKIEAILQ